MGILSSSDPTALPENLQWRYEPLKAGTHGPLMLAAPPLGFECHHPLKRTVPCLALLKGCTLPCPWCRYKRQWTTYVPFLDLSRSKLFKLVLTGGKKTFEDVKGLPVGCLIYAIRGANVKDTIRIRPYPEPIHQAQLAQWSRRCIDDISPYLFHLWQYRELTEHFRQKYYPSLRVMSNASTHASAHEDEDGNAIPQ